MYHPPATNPGTKDKNVIEYLSVNGIAARLNVSVNSIKGFRRNSLTHADETSDTSSGQPVNTEHFPAPDVKVGDTYGWSEETIDTWNQARPRRPHRRNRPGPPRKTET